MRARVAGVAGFVAANVFIAGIAAAAVPNPVGLARHRRDRCRRFCETGAQYLGIGLRHMTGTFTDVTSVPGASNPPFVVQENVKVATAGKTPAIPATPAQAGQIACSSQPFPGP